MKAKKKKTEQLDLAPKKNKIQAWCKVLIEIGLATPQSLGCNGDCKRCRCG